MRLRSLLISSIIALAAGTGMAFYLATHAVKIAMLGDSISDQMKPRQSGFPAPFNAATILSGSGYTLNQILGFVGSIPPATTHVILQGGTNDLLRYIPVIPGYKALLDAIPSTMRVIVIGVLPVDDPVVKLGFRDAENSVTIRGVNLQIVELCRSYHNCVVATGIMAMPMKGKTVDGIHPLAQTDNEIIGALMPLLGL
jgi:hypothetical protein